MIFWKTNILTKKGGEKMAIWKCGICGEIFYNSLDITKHLFIAHLNNNNSAKQNQKYKDELKKETIKANFFKISLN